MDLKNFNPDQQQALFENTLDWLDSLFLDLLPMFYEQDTTLSQATIMTTIVIRSLRGKTTTASDLVSILGKSRSTVDGTVTRLMMQDRLRVLSDPNDARRRIITIPHENGAELDANFQHIINWRAAQWREGYALLVSLGLLEYILTEGKHPALSEFLMKTTAAARELMERVQDEARHHH